MTSSRSRAFLAGLLSGTLACTAGAHLFGALRDRSTAGAATAGEALMMGVTTVSGTALGTLALHVVVGTLLCLVLRVRRPLPLAFLAAPLSAVLSFFASALPSLAASALGFTLALPVLLCAALGSGLAFSLVHLEVEVPLEPATDPAGTVPAPVLASS